MLGGRLTQRKNIRSPARYRGKRTDVGGSNILADDGSGGFVSLTIQETNDNILLEQGRSYNLDTSEPISPNG
tara:strand:- start:992 stop:1207 length:216 start_codon:yes stop_codon:yes gene_type:complete